MPDGAKFFIYSNDRKHSIGAFTSVNNKGDRKDIQGFATGLVYGDRVTLEYYLPNNVTETGVISVAYVVHGYRYIFLNEDEKNNSQYGVSGNCNININCSQGQGWQDEKNAVAKILINGTKLCTGSLVNTTANDNRPFFLTADHCLNALDAIVDNSPTLPYWLFYWHFESPTCTSDLSTIRSTSAAKPVANNSISDFALLQLTEDPRNKTGVTPYYLGWDRSGNAGTSGVGIHHPRGDIKKISAYTMTPQSTAYLSNTVNSNENHWRLTWSSGITEGGSSGSPLINNNGRVIGQLHGGHASCSALTSPDWYGKFSISWTGNDATDNRRKLQPWLDPAGTNPLTIDGGTPPPRSVISGPTLICSPPTTYTFTATNWRAGYSWKGSKIVVVNPPNANTITVYGANYYGGGVSGWVSIMFKGTEVARQNLWVGTPELQIIGPSSVYINSSYYPPNNVQYYCVATNNLAATNQNSYEWTVQPNIGFYGYGTQVSIQFPSNFSDYTVCSRASNACGLGNYAEREVSVWRSFAPSSVYPNPASNVVNIEIDTQAQSSAPAITAGTQLKLDKIYDLRLYDGQGNILRNAKTKGGTVQFNVSGLPNGIYYLHIYDGINPKPEIQQIAVEH